MMGADAPPCISARLMEALMSTSTMGECWVPERVKEYLRRLCFMLPLEDMKGHIRTWERAPSRCG